MIHLVKYVHKARFHESRREARTDLSERHAKWLTALSVGVKIIEL